MTLGRIYLTSLLNRLVSGVKYWEALEIWTSLHTVVPKVI